MAKIIDNHNERQSTVEQRDTVRKNRDTLIRKDERQRTIKHTVPVIFVLTITAGAYGFYLGRRGGYLDGVRDGYVKGGQELMASWREHSEQMRLSRDSDF